LLSTVEQDERNQKKKKETRKKMGIIFLQIQEIGKKA
jgi:hypothetical protein